ncbi:MAG: hypothetical protein ACR2ID_10180 [Chthoniobacterales bacterium]
MTNPTSGEQIPILPPDQTLYFNGFAIAVGMGDLVCTLLRNGSPVLTVNMSYTVAKSLGLALGEAVTRLQEMTGHEIMTVNTVTEATKR